MRTSAGRLLATAATLLAIAATPSRAQVIVFDPHAYVQSVLTASRSLQQITNQVTALHNQAQSLINQARNLQSLPYSSLTQLQASVTRTQSLLGQAQHIAYDVAAIDHAFGTTYAASTPSASNAALMAAAQTRWRTALASLQDAMRIQAGVVGNLDTNRSQTAALVNASQSATGALQAAQAGNQLLALQAQQLADLTAAVAAQGRAQALTSAQTLAAQSQGAEQLRRFLTPGAPYAPTDITIFH